MQCMTNDANEWKLFIMVGIFCAITWLLAFIIWLYFKYCCHEQPYNDYPSSTDFSRLTVNNDHSDTISQI